VAIRAKLKALAIEDLASSDKEHAAGDPTVPLTKLMEDQRASATKLWESLNRTGTELLALSATFTSTT
jgi:hypothetical protein